jgi:predicted glycogen debranching enzyme
MQRLEAGTIKQYARASQLEWLITNGLGGYSSSTVCGSNTRRYHGLLIAALKPPVGRMMLLQKLEETLMVGNKTCRLSVNEYPGAIYPTGYEYMDGFRLDPFPTFCFRADSTKLEKEICLVQGENTVIAQYRSIKSPTLVRLTSDVLVNYRDIHSLTRDGSSPEFSTEINGNIVKITRGKNVPFYLSSDKAKFEPTRLWYRNFVYREEEKRGLDFQEDAFNPGRFVVELEQGDSVNIAATLSEVAVQEPGAIIKSQREKAQTVSESANDEFLNVLLKASGNFLVRRDGGTSCIAGYHWFSDWGRDTMIALPGLTLIPNRFDEAKSILETFAQYVRYGLIPNCFSEADGMPQHNSLDATLWFFHALRKYLQYTRDVATVKTLYPVLKNSVEALLRGTIFEIKVDEDMLLNIGRQDVQLTWMDAKIGDFCVTPRNGKPVEINALWYFCLDTMSKFANLLRYKNDSALFAEMAERVKDNYTKVFWNMEANCLYDRSVSGVPDRSVRPNQIIAVALPEQILSREKEKAVVRCVENELLTPFGLRTLSPRDPNYEGRYEGDQRKRDLSYHQGPAWPWLLGPYLKAYIKTADETEEARRWALRFLEPMQRHLSEAGLGFVSELFDGDPPFQPRGCIAQAWSVAEILRTYYEDILDKAPLDLLES